jgi:hypothetical protein
MRIPNQEQIEAEGAKLLEERNELIKNFAPEDQEKFRIVDEVVEKLKAAGIIYFLFPYLPTKQGYNDFWQHNSFVELLAFDEKGAFQEKEISKINCAFLSAFFHTFQDVHGGDIIEFTKFLISAILTHADNIDKESRRDDKK